MQPGKYTSKRMPFPLPPPAWHPKHDGRFDFIGAIPPTVSVTAALASVSGSSAGMKQLAGASA